MKAYRHWEDGKQWLRILADDGMDWDEPITGWEEVHDLVRGRSYYRKGDIEISAA